MAVDIPLGPQAPEVFNTVIEIPRGSTNKYEWDPETGLFKLDRVLFSPLFYPFDYGFIPQTKYLDGDPLTYWSWFRTQLFLAAWWKQEQSAS